MLRNLNNFLKTSDRTLEGVVDNYYNGIIRNHKHVFEAANCHKYGNYFLDASLNYLPSYSGNEGQLFYNGMYLIVHSLAKRDMRNYVKLMNSLINEVHSNRAGCANKENMNVDDSILKYIIEFNSSKKKNQHNISTLETLFEGLNDGELKYFATKLLDSFWNRMEKSILLAKDLEKVEALKTKYAEIEHDSSLPKSLFLLNYFIKQLRNNWHQFSTTYFHIDFANCLKDEFPNRREQIYSIFANYAKMIISTIYLINYDKGFFDIYNEMNRVVVFEGADNLGKSTMIESLFKYNKEKFMDFSISEVDVTGDKDIIPSGVYWRKVDPDKGIPFNVVCQCDDINLFTLNYAHRPGGPVLKFHGYPYQKANGVPNLNYVQYFSKYKDLGPDSVYARQFANLYNIINMTMKSMEDYFTNKPHTSIVVKEATEKSESETAFKRIATKIEQRNPERILLQDRSVLSTIVYSLDRYKDTTKKDPTHPRTYKPTYLTTIMSNYLCKRYSNNVDQDVSRLKTQKEADEWIYAPEFDKNNPPTYYTESNVLNDSYHFAPDTNKGPLDFLNVYEEMISDEIFVKNSKLHPGCANFISLKFVFFESDSPFKHDEPQEKSLSEKLPEFIDKVAKGLNILKTNMEIEDGLDDKDRKIPSSKEELINSITRAYEKMKSATNNVQKSAYRHRLIGMLKLFEGLVKNEKSDNENSEGKKEQRTLKDFWEKTDSETWAKRNKDYVSIHESYISAVLSGIAKYPVFEPDEFIVDEPVSFFKNNIDDFSIYNPKSLSGMDLMLLITTKIFS